MSKKSLDECSICHEECAKAVLMLEAEYSDIARDYEIINHKQSLVLLEMEQKHLGRGNIAYAELNDILAAYLKERVLVDHRAENYFRKQAVANQQLADAKEELAQALRESVDVDFKEVVSSPAPSEGTRLH